MEARKRDAGRIRTAVDSFAKLKERRMTEHWKNKWEYIQCYACLQHCGQMTEHGKDGRRI